MSRVRNEGKADQRMELITGRRRQLHCSTAEEARIIAKSADPDANISAVAWNNGDKYPPAKPGTLECEPFKAAEKPATRPTHWSIRRFRAAGKLPRRCVAPSPSLDLELRAREVHNTKRRNATYVPAHPEKCTAGNVKLLLPPRQSRGELSLRFSRGLFTLRLRQARETPGWSLEKRCSPRCG